MHTDLYTVPCSMAVFLTFTPNSESFHVGIFEAAFLCGWVANLSLFPVVNMPASRIASDMHELTR